MSGHSASQGQLSGSGLPCEQRGGPGEPPAPCSHLPTLQPTGRKGQGSTCACLRHREVAPRVLRLQCVCRLLSACRKQTPVGRSVKRHTESIAHFPCLPVRCLPLRGKSLPSAGPPAGEGCLLLPHPSTCERGRPSQPGPRPSAARGDLHWLHFSPCETRPRLLGKTCVLAPLPQADFLLLSRDRPHYLRTMPLP